LKEVGRIGLGAFARIDAHRTMWRSLEATFRDPRLRQLFGRYATYCGSSPFEAPATLNVIAHVESLGVYRVVGGMRSLAAGLERLAQEVGVAIRPGADVAQILVRDRRAVGVELGTGERIEADAVVAAVDVSAVGSGLLGKAAGRAARSTAREARSFSAVTWAVAGRANGFPLLHHNVFFSADYRAECASLMSAHRVCENPTVYLCAQDRGDPPVDGEEERMLVIINAPANGDDPSAWDSEERERCEASMSSTLKRCGLQISPRASVQTTPAEFHRMFPGTGGALYGPIADGPLSSLSRLGARTRIAGLYLAGGSVHPGAGVPMAALSGRLAAQSLREDLPSTGRSHPVAISGSTSTA
jgi:1-hydroxycarotenoid 3,4-desaturase